MDRLNEAGARREGFTEAGSEPITLLDGQAWHVPRPYKLYRPTPDDAGGIGVAEEWSLGEEYAALVDAVDSAASDAEVVRAEFAAIRYLMDRNYDLTAAQFAGLVTFAYSKDAPGPIADMSESFRFLIRGLAVPKGR